MRGCVSLKARSELCDRVIAEDEEIDFLEKQVDQDAVTLLIRFDPVATDLSEVISAMKVSTDLERVGDESVTIARRAKRLSSKPSVSELGLLEPAYELAVSIFRDSVRAFADGDFELARTLKTKDKELDALTKEFIDKLLVQAETDSKFVRSCYDLIFVARALERIGDHVTNIAEDSFWRDQGDDIRHSCPPKRRNPIRCKPGGVRS